MELVELLLRGTAVFTVLVNWVSQKLENTFKEGKLLVDKEEEKKWEGGVIRKLK